MNKDISILRLHDLDKSFGGTHALDHVSFLVDKDEIHALVGTNGAGKSTLVKILTGAVKRDSGDIYLKGKPVEIHNPIHARRLGISAIYQEPTLIPYFNAMENIFLGHEPSLPITGHVNMKKLREDVHKILSEFNLSFAVDIPVSHLGVGEQRIIEVAKVLSYETEIIFVDEATAGMSDEEIKTFFKILRNLRERGITIIYISHYLEDIFKIANRVTILRDGKYIATEIMGETTSSSVIQQMIGKEVGTHLYPKKHVSRNEIFFKASSLSYEGKFESLSLELKRGEILGIAGPLGAGKTELARCIYGAEPKKTGKVITISGKEVTIQKPKDAKSHGIYYVPEDRRNHGIFSQLSVGVNITIGNIEKVTKGLFGLLGQKRMKELVEEVSKRVRPIFSDMNQRMNRLSGGNQQKIVLGKWIVGNPKILLLDEPTRGIDVGAKADIYNYIAQLAEKGTSIIFFSTEIDELVGLCHKILILYKGKFIKELVGEQITRENVLFYSTGGKDIGNGE